MPNDKYKIRFRIKDLQYNFGAVADEPVILLILHSFKFGEDNKSLVSFDNFMRHVWLYLNKSTFSQLTDYLWDGEPEDVKRLEKLLVGKEFYLDLTMKSTNEVKVEADQPKTVTA